MQALPVATDPNVRRRSNVNELADGIPVYSNLQLKLATGGWNVNNKLGQGGFASVYKGNLKNTPVAIKRIEYNNRNSEENIVIENRQIINELRALKSCRHDNILPLYGYSIDKQPCLVYQLMSGGSLESRLSPMGSKPLTFGERLNVAIGTAR